MKYKESQFNLAKSSGCSLLLGFLIFSLSFFINYEGLAMEQEENEKIDRSHQIHKKQAIELHEDVVILMKNIADLAYSDAQRDHNNFANLKGIEEEIAGITWKKYPFYTKTKADSHIGMIYSSETLQTLVVAFHGSRWIKDWLDDFNAFHFPASSLSPRFVGNVHKGFSGVILDCYEDMQDKIRKALGRDFNSNDHIFFTGHSLGGALAILGCAKFCQEEIDFKLNYIKAITFSAPRGVIGDTQFVKTFRKKVKQENILCFSTQGDLVPYAPQRIVNYFYPYQPLGINIEITPIEKLTGHYIHGWTGTLHGLLEHNAASIVKASVSSLLGWETGGAALALDQYFRSFHGLPADEPLKLAYNYAQNNYFNSTKSLDEIGNAPAGSMERDLSFLNKLHNSFQ